MFPVAVLVGAIGYSIESMISKQKPYEWTSVDKDRVARRAAELEGLDPSAASLKDVKLPATIFDRNLSPSLQNKQ
jgi:hypothetical protein